MTDRPETGLTIGQAAVFAGVTIKTVRHYHKLGLLDEPARDGSGYRRYTSPDLLRLVRVRTLADAGVPLASIGPLLASDEKTFAAALTDVDVGLSERIVKLNERRTMLQRLVSEDRTLLPDRAVAMLDGMPNLGFSAGDVTIARESFILARALVPDRFGDYLTRIEHALRDPDFVSLTIRSAAVAGWRADDPRVDQLAADMADHYLAHPDHLKIVTTLQADTETAIRYRLIAHHGEENDSAAARLAAVVESRLRAAGVEIPRSDRP